MSNENSTAMVGRGEGMGAAWSTIAPLLPASRQRGGQSRDHRTVITGILWTLRTGVPWRCSIPTILADHSKRLSHIRWVSIQSQVT